jgi:hypothetical protein
VVQLMDEQIEALANAYPPPRYYADPEQRRLRARQPHSVSRRRFHAARGRAAPRPLAFTSATS